MESKPTTQTIDAGDLAPEDIIYRDGRTAEVVKTQRRRGYVAVWVDGEDEPRQYGYDEGVEVADEHLTPLCLPPPLQW